MHLPNLRYDHLSEVIRKMLDDRAPANPVDFVEEISLNIKRYRFGMGKDLIRDAFYIPPPVLDDAVNVTSNWTVWLELLPVQSYNSEF